MKLYLLLPLLLILTTCSEICHAGYSVYVSPQVPEFVTVNGPYGTENWPNSEGQVLHPDHFCKPANYSRFTPEESRRTEIIRSSTGTLTDVQVLAVCPDILNVKYQRLWEAASAWERRNISGVALSLLTLGVSQGKPKALAIAAWSNRLWTDTYYPRKALISLNSEPDYDFSVVGDMPFSVPELAAEVWGQ